MEWILIIFLQGDVRLYPEPGQPPIKSKADCLELKKAASKRRDYKSANCFAVNEEGGYVSGN